MQKEKGCAEMSFAGLQCGTRARVTGRDVIQDEDIGASFPIAEGGFVGMARSIGSMLAWTWAIRDMRSETIAPWRYSVWPRFPRLLRSA
jgi:hypothetical protein